MIRTAWGRAALAWANQSLQRKGLAVMALPLCALLATALAYFIGNRQDERAEGWVIHSHEVRTDIQEALIFLLDAETSMRGYLLTGQDTLLKSYEKASKDLPKDLADLARLVQDNPVQRERMRRITSLVEQRLANLAALRASTALRTGPSTREAAQTLKGDAPKGDAIMHAVRQEFAAMQAVEDRLLAERTRRAEEGHKRILDMIWLSLVLGLSCGVAATLLFTRAIGARVRRLEENASQLAHGLPLSHRLPGNDEIGRLGEALTQSSVLLVEREYELRTTKEDAEQARTEADRANQAKSQFLSRMSHELRTPLNAILGFAQLLEMDNLTPDHREGVEQILKGGRHLLTLIDEVLEISKIEAGRLAMSPEPVQVGEVLRDVLDLFGPIAAQRNIRLHGAEGAVCDRHILADRQRLKQVLLNFLSNAVKYNRDGGEVRFSCEETVRGRVRIRVSDTGPGIPPDKLERLFTPFDRLGAEQAGIEGTGLGLALSKRLVEAMGGELGAESDPGRGSTFWVELALADGPVERVQRTEPQLAAKAELKASQKVQIVLYIEDNLSNLKLIQHILAHRPEVRLIPAMQGQLGMELALEHHPALILLDLHLPDMPGDEVLRLLQKDPETRHIPVVMITADATPGQIERLLAAGARDYLTKPLDVKKFLTVLSDVLHEGGAGGSGPRVVN